MSIFIFFSASLGFRHNSGTSFAAHRDASSWSGCFQLILSNFTWKPAKNRIREPLLVEKWNNRDPTGEEFFWYSGLPFLSYSWGFPSASLEWDEEHEGKKSDKNDKRKGAHQRCFRVTATTARPSSARIFHLTLWPFGFDMGVERFEIQFQTKKEKDFTFSVLAVALVQRQRWPVFFSGDWFDFRLPFFFLYDLLSSG